MTKKLRSALRVIDCINEQTGRLVRWFAVAMILFLTYEVMARYGFNAPTQWAHVMTRMFMGALIALGWGWVHLHRGHVSIDVLYRHLSPRAQAITDVTCAVLFFFPLLILLVYTSSSWLIDSWELNEKWTVSFWRPPITPSRAVILIGFLLLLFQGIAKFVRDLYFVIRGKAYD